MRLAIAALYLVIAALYVLIAASGAHWLYWAVAGIWVVGAGFWFAAHRVYRRYR